MNYIDFIRHFNIKVEKGNKAMALCPAHNDKNPSLCITLSQDREKILIKCFAGCETRDILSAVNLKMSDLYTHICPKSQAIKSKPEKVNETCYKYYDADGSILYTKVRNDYADGTKDFFFQNSKGGKTLKGVKTVPYNLPQVLKSSTVYFVEGEKCADAVIKEGYCATTLHAGAKSKWESDYARYFEGRQVIVIPDNDKPGFEYARKILAYLPGACMKVIPKENIPGKYDIADFLRDGGSMKDIENASVYTELEEENADSDNQEENSSKSQIEIAMELIKKNGIKVCVNQSNEYWGIVQSGEHTETFLMKSDEFKAQFRWMFYQETKKYYVKNIIKLRLNLYVHRQDWRGNKTILHLICELEKVILTSIMI